MLASELQTGLFESRGVAQPGRALVLGTRSRQFESGHPEISSLTHEKPLELTTQ